MAATRAFHDLGPDAPMEVIARRAGVGVGTLYRRFPDRNALVLAVIADDLSRLLERTREAGASEGSHWDRLVRALELGSELGSTVRLAAQLPPDIGLLVQSDPAIQRTQADLLAAVDRLLGAAQEEGSARLDIGTGDVALLFSMLLETGTGRGSVPSARTRSIVIDGLRPQVASILPGHPLGTEDLTF